MSADREVVKIMAGRRTSDGAGVKLTRLFSNEAAELLDPFLLLDHFSSDRPEDYMAGFPMHPHRGIETVTYMLDGYVDHRDSLGNKGTIGPGDVQWMTAGRGIMHEEMPRRSEGWMRGYQLWVNLPRVSKMMPPRYRDVPVTAIPTVDLGRGSNVKVIAGEFDGTAGPVKDLVVEMDYWDLNLAARTVLEHEMPKDRNAFIMVHEGEVKAGTARKAVGSKQLALFGEGDAMRIEVGKEPSRFLFVSGRPLREPIAWGGPIVMNTSEDLDQAFREIRDGTFIRRG